MTIILDEEWPATLPLPSIDYSGYPRYTTIVDLENAFVATRRSRFQMPYYGLSVSWVFNEAQFAAFEFFLLNNLGNGTAQFKMELRYPKNSSLTEWAVRLGLGYEADYEDGNWMVSASLELISRISSIELAEHPGAFVDPETGGGFIDPETGFHFVDPEA